MKERPPLCPPMPARVTKDWYYKVYLKSAWWKYVTKQIKARSGGTCEQCLRRKAHTVHHVSYERLGAERFDIDLQHVCTPCHRRIHAPAYQKTKRWKRDQRKLAALRQRKRRRHAKPPQHKNRQRPELPWWAGDVSYRAFTERLARET